MSIFNKTMEEYQKYPSGIHEKLFVAIGNGYEADKIGATGAIVFAFYGFNGNVFWLDEYLEREKEQPKGLKIRVCANKDMIKKFSPNDSLSFIELEERPIRYEHIIPVQLTAMADAGHKVIAITPLRTFDGTLGRENDEAALQTIKKWLECGGAEKVDEIVYMSLR